MKKNKQWQGISLSLAAVLGAIAPGIAQANDLDAYVNLGAPQGEATGLEQVNGVFSLRDVEPSDWAFDALRGLVERYGCIQGYPNGTFLGDRTLTRHEFAAGLNACMQSLEAVLSGGGADGDLETLQRLVSEFETELAELGQKVDDLEGRIAFLEDHQFSTTTKLYGQMVLGLQARTNSSSDFLIGTANAQGLGVLGEDNIKESSDQTNVLSLGYNANLSLITQLDPKSWLVTGLQAGNLSTGDPSAFGFNNSFTRLGYEGNTNSSLRLSDANYRRLLGDNFAVVVGSAGVSPVNVFRGPSRIESTGYGPISRFAQRNPIIQLGGGSAGFGFDWQATDKASVQGVYSAPFANGTLTGLFNNSYTLGVQALFTPTETIDTSLYYLKSYSGANAGTLQMGVGDDLVAFVPTGGTRLNTDAFGATANLQIMPKLTIGSWFGFTSSNLVGQNMGGSVETTNWMFSLQLPDLFQEGNYGAIFFGQPPRITESNLTSTGTLSGNIPSFFAGTGGTVAGGRADQTLHLEAFYRMKVSDDIAITPGIITVFNPGHSNNNDTITIGALRTTLSF